jgi:hypothetical protein
MSTQPIAKEIKQISGFENIDELRDAMPRNIDTPADIPQPKKRGRKPGETSKRKSPAMPATAPDPYLTDPRYQAACARMACFGGKGMIVRGFDAGARVLEDDSFKLNEQENLIWDDFFYVLSKKPLFDVGRPIFLALFFVITLLAQLGWRVVERSQSPFIESLFTNKPAPEESEKQTQ